MSQWSKLNEDCFGGTLTPPPEVDWADTPPGSLAVYGQLTGVIAISREYSDVEQNFPPKCPEETHKVLFVLGLLLHEMIHQRVHQIGGGSPASHGQAFVDAANAIPPIWNWPLCTLDNAPAWPLHTCAVDN